MVLASLLLGERRSVAIDIFISLLEDKWEGSPDLCPEVWSRSAPITFLEGKGGGRHSACHSDLGKWRSVVEVTPNASSRREEGREPWTLPLSS